MSKVLSVYNEWAFCEIVLPAVTNVDYTFLLDAELFHLKRNEVINLECVHGKWKFDDKNNKLCIETDQADTFSDIYISESERYHVVTPASERLTILAEDRDNPLSVYNKYTLVSGKQISVGLDGSNTIRYSYPNNTSTKSFVSHHHCTIQYDGKKAVLKDMSSNGTYVNNIRVDGTRILAFGDSIRIFGLNIIYLGNLLAINAPQGMDIDLSAASISEIECCEEVGNKDGSSQKTLFFRAPRIVPKINMETISIDPPPNPKEIANVPLLMQIGPAMTMAIPMLLGSGLTIAASRMSGMANSALMLTGIITASASAAIGTFWAVINMRYSKKTVRESEKQRYQKYGQYLIDKQSYIEKLYEVNSKAYCDKYLSAAVIADYTAVCEKLWNRNFNHSDVLTYRVGIGSVPLPATIEVPKEKFTMIDDSLAEKPQLIKNRFQTMHDVPVCVNLKEKSLIGIIGEANGWAQIIKNLIVQIAGNNSYTDVKIAFVYDITKSSNSKKWEFIKWFPHIWSEDKKTRFYATNKNEANEVFYTLGQIMRTRSEDGQVSTKPYVILFVLNKELLDGELMLKYIGENSSDIGLSTVIAAERYEELPNHCEFIIENNTMFSGVYSTINENVEQIPITFDQVSDDKLISFAKCLANIEVNEEENGGEIPPSVSFFEMFGISKPEELNSSERWRKAKTSETMKAVIGLKNGKTPCYLDIHERYHGPHGLVAGTTGSGKSETLQTFMLSLAINYSPDDVGFFIIDYKGGGMANLFNGLPHVIGAISNLSGNQVKRAMVSIKSENKRRQRLFSDYGVNNINAYTSLYKSGDAKEPIPHMLIIIDEFAELKREEPDFMRELVSVAQVGRSLGVHLILATQKPSGTVDDNIWSNSKFKLCLRVQDRQDSMDMLHRTDAAYLTQAGRGYLQVGNDEIFELFQSGYSGAAYDEALGDKKLVVAQMLDSVGKVDLVGNHFKIQHQEKAQQKWIHVLYDSAHQAIQECNLLKSAEDDILFNRTLLDAIYRNIAYHGMDFKRSQYNDARLSQFVKLLTSLDSVLSENAVEVILDAARKQGIHLPEQRSKTQLEAVNEYLYQIAQKNGYTHSIMLWMPVLSDCLVLSEIEGYRDLELQDSSHDKPWSLSAVIGKGDDPENQNQMPISIDFANNGHHAICGTVSTGKSTLLQTMVYALINKYSSDQINIYLIDFSAKLLNVFSSSEQVGGIMTDSEEDIEKISKFFTMMFKIIEERKKFLASSTFTDYVKHSNSRLPAIVIVIDNYAAFKEKTDERYEDMIRQIAREGISYGIYLLVTAGGFGTSEISVRLADNFRTTMCLEMSDIYQYSDVMRVVKVPIYPEANVKGRGLVYYGDKIIEFQTALACSGESIFERNDKIRRQIEQINLANTGKPAKKIPIIPDKPMWSDYVKEEDYTSLIHSKMLLPNGYDFVTAAYSAINLSTMLTYAVSGTKKSGKSNYMKTLIQACVDKSSEVCIIEIDSSEFAHIADETESRYITDGKGIYDFARKVLLVEAGNRAKRKADCMAKNMEHQEFFEAMSSYRRYCIFIPNIHGFLKELYNRESEAFQAVDVYETLVGDKGFYYNFYFFAEVHDAEISEVLGYPFMRSFKDNGIGIRFGGKYQSQKLFDYANISYKLQSSVLKPGVGVVPSDDENARQNQIVVPYYKG